MKLSREWATPLTMGVFTLMAVTGVLMFFHLNSGLNKLFHEWAGWLMIGGVLLHVLVNKTSFKRHFVAGKTGPVIMLVCVLALAASFFSLPGMGPGKHGDNPAMLAFSAVSQAPLTQVAQLAGKPVEQVITELAQAGIIIDDPQASLAQSLGRDFRRQGAALRTVFANAER
ncbi:hypothetical protein A11A3_00975 [Alcanivorax hongdengensis A-11-3]|uniref:Flavinylation-associated cytochrome domain-containing protein n=2 Tax=Alcanivorax hongdengensis TaxID=519051 RepID=L0WGP1_9GAMM|nr:hypothetical protein A11A3_00975 [Alcanivorax hongdengensis A-11-3]